ncbi:MAG: hypothetical protein ACREMT_11270, partial [Vulcanimicrobiaceae bacterium]
DSFQIGSRDLRTETTYDGSETLTITALPAGLRYVAKATYDRSGAAAAAAHETATFVSFIARDGRERDEHNGDPEFLTVLNQPFAAQLDAETLRDVRDLSAPSPFAFSSSMAGTALHGTLRRAPDGLVAGKKVVGIAFDATGPIHGGVPGHPEIVLTGTMRMSGTAYYHSSDALLLELDATLQIAGNLADESTSDQVRIVYRRTIRAEKALGDQAPDQGAVSSTSSG